LTAAVQIVVQVSRLSGGRRKITQISEVTGSEGDVIRMHDIFAFQQTGTDPEGSAYGKFEATGIRPYCLDRIRTAGIDLPNEMFERRELTFASTTGT
jgi:pilus assembly protein CpaF